jgi:hypothetical protein
MGVPLAAVIYCTVVTALPLLALAPADVRCLFFRRAAPEGRAAAAADA